MSSLREMTPATLLAAHKAGATYWTKNRPHGATLDNLKSVARSCGFDDECGAWLLGYCQAREMYQHYSKGN